MTCTYLLTLPDTNNTQDLALETKFSNKTLEDVVKLKKRDVLVTAAMHLRRKQHQETATSLNNLIACFKVCIS